MTELTKEQKVFVLKEMIRYYGTIKGDIISSCGVISGIICWDLKLKPSVYNYNDLNIYFPEYFAHKPKGKTDREYWFPNDQAQPRLAYCKKILKLIQK
jgi:hypothetical protein